YNDQYYLIMTDTYKGTYHVLENGKLKSYPFSGQANSTAAALGEVKYPAFFINMNNRCNPWGEKQYMITNLYANWQGDPTPLPDRKSTRLNSSHVKISYAVCCLK